MKSLSLKCGLLLILGCASLEAFDSSPQYPDSSLSLTVSHVSNVRLPLVDYPDGPLLEVVTFIRCHDIPERLGVTIDVSKIPNHQQIRVKLVAKNITILEAAAAVAEQLDAELRIEPGKIHIVPRSESKRGEQPVPPKSDRAGG